ncbi:hypothetical protein NMY22_g4506 [Coprinellus aureogranulatus]|nr:hypothetical protein NMY22_g4506 [Coprinellus aureogranulatus]
MNWELPFSKVSSFASCVDSPRSSSFEAPHPGRHFRVAPFFRRKTRALSPGPVPQQVCRRLDSVKGEDSARHFSALERTASMGSRVMHHTHSTTHKILGSSGPDRTRGHESDSLGVELGDARSGSDPDRGNISVQATYTMPPSTLCFLNDPQADSHKCLTASRVDILYKITQKVSAAMRSAANGEHNALNLAVADEPPADKYAQAIFKNLINKVEKGPEDLLTHLTQDVFVGANPEVEERHGRYTEFTQLISEPTLLEGVRDTLRISHHDLRALQDLFETSPTNQLATFTNAIAQDIPVLDFAIAIFPATAETFVAYYRLRLSVFVDVSQAINAGSYERGKIDANLVAGMRRMVIVNVLALTLTEDWEKRTFHLRGDFIAGIEEEIRRLGKDDHLNDTNGR